MTSLLRHKSVLHSEFSTAFAVLTLLTSSSKSLEIQRYHTQYSAISRYLKLQGIHHMDKRQMRRHQRRHNSQDSLPLEYIHDIIKIRRLFRHRLSTSNLVETWCHFLETLLFLVNPINRTEQLLESIYFWQWSPLYDVMSWRFCTHYLYQLTS